jgi:hypothetical protein
VKNAWFVVIPLSLYGLACALPAYWEGDGTHPAPGFVCLVLVPYVMFCLPWWANPPFLAGCIAMSRGRADVAMVLGIMATALAATFFPMKSFGSAGIGSAVWMMSMVSLAIAAGIAWRPSAKAGVRSGSPREKSRWDDL